MKHQMTTIELVILNGEIVEGNHKSWIYPKSVPLNEKLNCRTVSAILRTHKPNPGKHPEKFAHHLH